MNKVNHSDLILGVRGTSNDVQAIVVFSCSKKASLVMIHRVSRIGKDLWRSLGPAHHLTSSTLE